MNCRLGDTRRCPGGAPGARARCPRRGNRWRGHRADRSAAGYVDGDGDRVADDVPDGRVAGEAGELGKLVVVEVSAGLYGDPDLLVTGAGTAVEAEETLQVQVALDGGLHAVECDAAGGGVVDDRACHARGEGVQDVLDSVGCPVLAEQDRRLVGVHGK